MVVNSSSETDKVISTSKSSDREISGIPKIKLFSRYKPLGKYKELISSIDSSLSISNTWSSNE